MNNAFGKSLRQKVREAGVKESELARVLGYDGTYINKWMNGSKLPSVRNAEWIISRIADYLAEISEAESKMALEEKTSRAEKARKREQYYAELKAAYDTASSEQFFQNYQNGQLSFLDNRKDLLQIIREACRQALNLDGHEISIIATFDLFALYGKEFTKLLEELNEIGVKHMEMKLMLDCAKLVKAYDFYTTGILEMIGCLDFVEMTISKREAEVPAILIVNRRFYMQILSNVDGETTAAFSMKESVIDSFADTCRSLFDSAEKILDFAEPESLKRTNVQLDSYSDSRQWLFFNEAPALLFPENIMDSFIKKAQDESYSRYLTKLKNVFERRTSKSRIDIVIYASMLHRYLSDGVVNVGNYPQQLSQNEIAAHLEYLSGIMKKNPQIHLYLLRDTSSVSEKMKRTPSVFLDTYSVYIENSKASINATYHISTRAEMRESFQKFFETMLAQSYCMELAPDDLLRYL